MGVRVRVGVVVGVRVGVNVKVRVRVGVVVKVRAKRAMSTSPLCATHFLAAGRNG